MKKIILILAILFSISLSAQEPIETNKKYNFTIDGDTIELTEIEVVEPPQNEVYTFDKREWNIYEGKVSDEKALHNREQMNTAIQFAKAEGYTVFEIGDLNAYFDVQAGFGGSKIENYRRSIQLPSNFELLGNGNSNIRVQPNDKRDYAAIMAWETIGTKITNVNVWGDRNTHDYDGGDIGVQDLGYGIYLIGTIDAVVDGVQANEFTGDGLVVSSPRRRNIDGSEKEGTQYSKNLVVKNSTFDGNRRNGLALTDVIGAVLDNNTYSNNGGGTRPKGAPYDASGVIPKAGIDLEAINPMENGKLSITEIVRDVKIINSTFTNNVSDITLYKASEGVITKNKFDGGIGNVASFNFKIYANDFVALNEEKARAIIVKPRIREDGSHFTKDFQIYNNRISGYKTAISIGGENQKVYENTIKDFDDGVFLLEGKDVFVSNNTLESKRDNARGFYNYPGGFDAINYTLIRNTVKTTGKYAYGFFFKKITGENFIMDDCHFDSRVRINNSQNISIQNSTFPSYNFSKGNTNIQDINNN